MTIYSSRDAETDFDGDLVLSPVGDISLANSLTTQKSAANFVLRTNYGEYAPNSSIGANLGSFVGKLNTRQNAEYMENNINSALRSRIFSFPDVSADVFPFDINEVMCIVTLRGSYFIDDTIQSVEGERISYIFPYFEGRFATPITI